MGEILKKKRGKISILSQHHSLEKRASFQLPEHSKHEHHQRPRLYLPQNSILFPPSYHTTRSISRRCDYKDQPLLRASSAVYVVRTASDVKSTQKKTVQYPKRSQRSLKWQSAGKYWMTRNELNGI
jgi:hypothetical protein